LNRLVTRHLRGSDTADATLAAASQLGEALARAHHALATPSAESVQPTQALGADGVQLLLRRVKDSFAEATVLAEVDLRQTLQAHLPEVRATLELLADAEAATATPPVPLGQLEQFVRTDDRLTLDPLLVVAGGGPHLPVVDVARLLRQVAHVAHGALRRLVSGGEDVPAERVPTWVGAVRELLLERYEATLAAYGQSPLFERQLLRTFEIAAECEALVWSTRNLATWRAVPEAGLVELVSGR
jgi:predicted trehalose synthase